jgi:hypothetical protein
VWWGVREYVQPGGDKRLHGPHRACNGKAKRCATGCISEAHDMSFQGAANTMLVTCGIRSGEVVYCKEGQYMVWYGLDPDPLPRILMHNRLLM